MGDGFSVDPAVLDSTAERLAGQAERSSRLIAGARTTAVPADSWGRLGQGMGLNDRYARVLESADRSLDEVRGFLAAAETALKQVARTYADADGKNARLFTVIGGGDRP